MRLLAVVKTGLLPSERQAARVERSPTGSAPRSVAAAGLERKLVSPEYAESVAVASPMRRAAFATE